jgi:hypothetical protein
VAAGEEARCLAAHPLAGQAPVPEAPLGLVITLFGSVRAGVMAYPVNRLRATQIREIDPGASPRSYPSTPVGRPKVRGASLQMLQEVVDVLQSKVPGRSRSARV